MVRVRGSQTPSTGLLRRCRTRWYPARNLQVRTVRGREASEAGDPFPSCYSKLQSIIHFAMEVLMGPFKEEVPGPDPPVKRYG